MYFAQLGEEDELHPPHKFSRVTCDHGIGGTGVGVSGVRAPM